MEPMHPFLAEQFFSLFHGYIPMFIKIPNANQCAKKFQAAKYFIVVSDVATLVLHIVLSLIHIFSLFFFHVLFFKPEHKPNISQSSLELLASFYIVLLCLHNV